jgi:hypothetical protein
MTSHNSDPVDFFDIFLLKKGVVSGVQQSTGHIKHESMGL